MSHAPIGIALFFFSCGSGIEQQSMVCVIFTNCAAIVPPFALSGSTFKQIRRQDVQRIGDAFNHIHRGVPRAVLHMTKLGQADLCRACQLHLSHIRLISIPHDVVAQHFSQFHIHLPFHFKGRIWKWQAVYSGADIRLHIFHNNMRRLCEQ